MFSSHIFRLLIIKDWKDPDIRQDFLLNNCLTDMQSLYAVSKASSISKQTDICVFAAWEYSSDK
jgi:hypothetical protein